MLEEFFQTYAANRKLTYDLLEQLSVEDLKRVWPRPGLNTFSKHFEELAAVEDSFSGAVISGSMSFDTVPDVFNFQGEADKKKLLTSLQQADQALERVVRGADSNKKIDWYGLEISLPVHISNIISHEVFHQGMMAMALYQFGLPIPDSWVENWALPKTCDTGEK